MEWKKETYLIMTLDPVHIGTGGYRLGRVDNAITREPGSNLPKIPGTGLSGAVRSAAAYHYRRPKCAGQADHCGSAETCPICYTFGSARGDNKTFAGAISLFDAQLLLFPVWSMFGPVWATTKEILERYGFGGLDTINLEQDDQVAAATGVQVTGNALNLGWLMLKLISARCIITAPQAWQSSNELSTALQRTVVLHPNLFSHIVNSNLEVRTSVSIDPFTGAARTGALFTYEAIPRATFLVFDVVMDDYRQGKKPWEVSKTYNETSKGDNAGENLSETWSSPLDVVKTGLCLIEYLGIGGMGTRGFGRIKQLGSPIVSQPWQGGFPSRT